MFLQAAPDLERVGEAASGAEAVRVCERTQPQVVLMDLWPPELDGIAATQAIRNAHPDIQVIAVTGWHDELVVDAPRAGAIGCFPKDVGVAGLPTPSARPGPAAPRSRPKPAR